MHEIQGDSKVTTTAAAVRHLVKSRWQTTEAIKRSYVREKLRCHLYQRCVRFDLELQLSSILQGEVCVKLSYPLVRRSLNFRLPDCRGTDCIGGDRAAYL